MKTVNPFSVVKATEYTNDEILNYWVRFGDDDVLTSLNPQELMPKYILGSKGCGKTHILRFYSYEGRLSKFDDDIRSMLKNDGYIAIYSKLDGLSSMRFKTVSGQETLWVSLYNYYFEINQSIIALSKYQDILAKLEVPDSIENDVIETIAGQVGIQLSNNTIDSLIQYLTQKKILIDRSLIDFAFDHNLDDISKIKPEFPFGALIFDIPHVFASKVEDLSGINVIYVLDEYEKLHHEWQKHSLNTLVFEKKYNCTFWVGARKNGYTTRDTLTGEPIHEGHEFQPIDLDKILKSDDRRFRKFAEDLFNKRLEVSGINVISPNAVFAKYDESALEASLLAKSKELKHWSMFRQNLIKVAVPEEKCEMIIEALKVGAVRPVDQKLKLFLFYQKWAELRESFRWDMFIDIAYNVNDEYAKYKRGDNPKVAEKYSKFKHDWLAQLALENGLKYYLYSGFDELVNISDCNPRVFLTLMKLVVADSIFRGVDPFDGVSQISVESQYYGINETSSWFLNDIEVYGADREVLNMAMEHILAYLYINRFCDKPVEKSLCAFYFRQASGLESIKKVIDQAEKEDFLIEIDERRDKSLGTPQKAYQINRLIATLYNLPISRGGVMSINPTVMKSIFDKDSFAQFNSFLASRKSSLNAPFNKLPDISEEKSFEDLTLFD